MVENLDSLRMHLNSQQNELVVAGLVCNTECLIWGEESEVRRRLFVMQLTLVPTQAWEAEFQPDSQRFGTLGGRAASGSRVQAESLSFQS